MMKNKFSKEELQANEWIKRASEDELSANVILKEEGGAPNTVCFLSQQMAEKYLKAFLIQHKKWYPKIHLLDSLWELCEEIDKSFEEIKKDSIFLTTFYTSARYPGDYPEFGWKDAEDAFKAAGRIKEFILGKIYKN